MGERRTHSCKPVLLPKKIDGGPHPKALQHPMALQQDDAKILRAEHEATKSWPKGSSGGGEVLEVPALQSRSP